MAYLSKNPTIPELTKYLNREYGTKFTTVFVRNFVRKNLFREVNTNQHRYAANIRTFVEANISVMKNEFEKMKELVRQKKAATQSARKSRAIKSSEAFFLPDGYYKGISPESIECLDNDEIDYARYNQFHHTNEFNELEFERALNENSLFYDHRNSDNQEVPETGKHSENVYLKDCPFMMGKDQVEFFKLMQEENERHTIKDVDDFISNAKKPYKEI